MGLDVSSITAASLKAKDVATQEYVDTEVGNIDVIGDIDDNNDVFAQKLGYNDYDAMVAAAAAGQTVINGGYINTGLINANAITADQINTAGLIAENVSATEITGKTITGGIINGARINGAVIAASYLDLDGELEVLTNYHLCLSQTALDAVIASGSTGRLVVDADKVENGGDAVYVEADNEYRIPSISTIKSSAGSATVLSTGISPYNETLAGHNNKCVQAIPSFSVLAPFKVYKASTWAVGIWQGATRAFYNLYVNGVHSLYIWGKDSSQSSDSMYIYIKDMVTGSVTTLGLNMIHTRTSTYTKTKTLDSGLNIRVEFSYYYTTGMGWSLREMDFDVYLESSYVTPSTDFVSGDLITASVSNGTGYSPSGIVTVNNLA